MTMAKPVVDNEHLPWQDYGAVVGAYDGVVFRSNGDSYFFSGVTRYKYSVNCGISFQCVQGVRETMIVRQGYCFPQCGPAGGMVDDADYHHVMDLTTGEKLPWLPCYNGKTKRAPIPGAAILYRMSRAMPVGHIAVISAVELDAQGNGWVGIAEENEGSKKWIDKAGKKYPFCRTATVTRDAEGVYHVKEDHPHFKEDMACWMLVGDENGGDNKATYRRELLPGITPDVLCDPDKILALGDECYKPMKVMKQFITQHSAAPKKLARFSFEQPYQMVAVESPDFAAATDFRDKQVDEEQDTVRQTRLMELKEARVAARAAKTRIVNEYLRLQQDCWNEVEQKLQMPFAHSSVNEAVQRGELPFSRASVPRRAGLMQSAYTPNNMSSVSFMMSAYRLLGAAASRFAKTLLKGGDERIEAEARNYLVPADLFTKMLQQVVRMVDGAPARSSVLPIVNSGLGTLGFVQETGKATATAEGFRIIHTELDSLSSVVEIHALQERFVRKHLGITNTGWIQNNFGADFTRYVRHSLADPAGTVVFVDFGPVEEVRKTLPFPSKEAEYVYNIERHNALLVAEYLTEFLIEKQHDRERGEIGEDDDEEPRWKLLRLNFFGEDIKLAEDGKVLYKPGGSPDSEWRTAEMVFKMQPWSQLIMLLQRNSSNSSSTNSDSYKKLHAFVNDVAAHPNSTVTQPLWTAFVSNAHFMPALSRIAKDLDETPDGEEDRALADLRDWLRSGAGNPHNVSSMVIPIDCWPERNDPATASAVPKCTYSVAAHTVAAMGPHNPALPGSSPPGTPFSAPMPQTAPARAGAVAAAHPVFTALVIGGKRSAVMVLEGRSVKKSASDEKEAALELESIWGLVHPSAFVFIMGLFSEMAGVKQSSGDDEEEEKDE